jgi:diguanylate cyclase (GGDEF)-like protein
MERTLAALIVEDSEDDAMLLARHLTSGGYRVNWRRVETRDALKTALNEQEWDIVFGDYTMPHFNGTDALDMIRRHGLDIPFIFVSGTIGEDTAVQAMKAGAQDYIIKGSLKRLLPAVERELREAESRRDRRRTEEDLRLLQSITHDASEAQDIFAALARALTRISEAGDWSLAQAWLPRVDATVIECSPAWYRRDGNLESMRRASLRMVFAPGEGLPGRAWRSKQPLWVRDVTEEPGFQRAQIARDAGLQSAMAVPVASGSDVLAVLEFFARDRRESDARQMQLMETVAAQLGVAIQRKRTEERLNYLAHYDALTNLPNRVLFNDRLEQAILDAGRHGRLVGVAHLDLDRFKTINDSLGHDIGDLFLRAVAERLRRFVRGGDTVARLVGDEFTMILADMAHVDDAARVAQKILESLSQSFLVAGHELFTSASLGMTLYPTDEGGAEGLLRNADIAMHRAKESGGNTYAFYSVDMTTKVQERLALEHALRRALEHDELRVHYQPVVNLRSGRLAGFEALVRWMHPQRGEILPMEFIPLAEETGLITRLDQWVVRKACTEFAAFLTASGTPLRLAVNLSARQFQQTDFVKSVLRIIDETKFDPKQLDMEVTETSLMQNAEVAASVMRDLGEIGVRFSIDDFGTGYSSLAYLKHLPIGSVKIDKSFVRDVPTDTNDAAIVTAIIAMAHNLGLEVVAEGVETQEQLEFLRANGCDAVQGWHFSRAWPKDDVVRRFGGDASFPWS